MSSDNELIRRGDVEKVLCGGRTGTLADWAVKAIRAIPAVPFSSVDQLVEVLRNIRDNYDCDTDAHKHGTPCRCCTAREALSKYWAVPPAEPRGSFPSLVAKTEDGRPRCQVAIIGTNQQCRRDESHDSFGGLVSHHFDAPPAGKVCPVCAPESSSGSTCECPPSVSSGPEEAIRLALRYGGIDGAHHKTWVIDQMLRALTGSKYEEVIREAKAGEDGPDTYEWDEGIAP